MKITWLGHATVLIESGETRLLTDPVLRDRVAHLRRRSAPVAAPGEVDAVLVSHAHRDHLDLPSLRRVPHTRLIGPPGSSSRRHPTTVLEAGDIERVGEIEIRATRAVHDGRRSPLRRRRADDAIGYIFESNGTRVYFAGDTAPFAAMSELRPVDVALLPIWGWGATLGSGHMNPAEAAATLPLIQPRIAIPIHWGTFLPIGQMRRHHAMLHRPLDEFQEHAATEAPAVHVAALAPGESIDVRK